MQTLVQHHPHPRLTGLYREGKIVDPLLPQCLAIKLGMRARSRAAVGWFCPAPPARRARCDGKRRATSGFECNGLTSSTDDGT